MSILVTGGAGFIGSHASLALLEAGERVVVLDNFSNSCSESLARIEQITGKPIVLVEGNLSDVRLLKDLFHREDIEAVIHFAGLKAVGESVEKPLIYFQNNVAGSIHLFEAMEAAGVYTLIFSSSATVYGAPDLVPIKEEARVCPTNPYGHTKAMVEVILQGLAKKPGSLWKIALLRYFNPIGAHLSGKIGEDPRDIPNNLVPYISRVAIGTLETLSVFGNDYPTADGTGVRDYIHVMDLVEGHLSALGWLKQQNNEQSTCEVFNLGTGQGYSVLEVVNAFEQILNKNIPYKIVGRRTGDIAICYADASKAERLLGWKAKRSLEEMVADTWNWQKKNPQGYR